MVSKSMSLALLRQQTSVVHQRLENRLQLFSNVSSMAGYGEHLQKLHECFRQAEAKVSVFASDLPLNWSERKKLPWLEQDLAALKLIPIAQENEKCPPCASVAEAMGMLYVMEGSSLGGRVISAHYGALLGLNPQTGLRFFTGHGESTGILWKEFLRALESLIAADPERAGEVNRSAQRTFEFFEQILCEPIFAGVTR